MYENPSDAYMRISRMISELQHYAFLQKTPLTGWSFSRVASAVSSEDGTVTIGFQWNPEPFPVYFEKTVRLSAISQNQRLLLRASFGGETLVSVDCQSFAELNEEHHEIDLTPYCDEEEHQLTMEVVPRSLFGRPVHEPALSDCTLLLADKEVFDVFFDLQQVAELLRWTSREDLSSRLCMLLDRVLSMIDIPRDTRSYRSSIVDDSIMSREVNSVWSPERFDYGNVAMLTQEQRASVLRAGVELWNNLSELRDLYPNTGSMTVFGHAHIDYAWLWPVDETKRKIIRTFANTVRLAQKYPEFVFAQSSAKMFKELKKRDLSLYKKVERLVRSGRLEPIGGSWVEFDSNLANPESLIRQFLMGQTYFRKDFGAYSKVAWLPDAFGFTWVLPQILRGAGIEYFVTTKLNWNDKNPFPYDLCRWRGIDGSEVVYHSFNNPNEGYNGHLDARDIIQTWDNYRNKDYHMATMLSNGYGDGGGGPTDEMIERYLRLKDFPDIPALKMRKTEDFFEDVRSHIEELPVWDGELYLEKHRGTSSAQSRTKKLHKQAEDALFKTEFIASVLKNSQDYPYEDLCESWDTLLTNEFHDILPGSSIKEVYIQAETELRGVIDRNQAIQDQITRSCAKLTDDGLTVINLSSSPQPLSFVLDDGLCYSLSTESGMPIESQTLADGSVLYMCERKVDPFEMILLKRLDPLGSQESKRAASDDFTIENEHLRAEVLPDGSISIFDKDLNRKVFDSSGNQLFLYKDIPPYWDAWDVASEYDKHGKRLLPDCIERVEWGPLRNAVRVFYRKEDTRIVQVFSLARGARRIDIETAVDWHMRRTMLKAVFSLSILARRASFDLGSGYIQRPTHRNRSTDQAMFEVPAQRWVDMSEYGFGTSILNNGLYGYSARENALSLTLLRSPVFPDFLADEGAHRFVYSIYSHDGSSLLSTLRESDKINQPLFVAHGMMESFPERVLEMGKDSETLRLMALKRSEDGKIVVRLCETLGRRGKTFLKLNLAHSRAFAGNILEETLDELKLTEEGIELLYEPFKIITLLFL